MTVPDALHELIVENSARIVELTAQRRRLRGRSRQAAMAFDAVPGFLSHLADALAPTTSRHAFGVVLANVSRKLCEDAEHMGRILQRRGCSMAQVISAYGDIYQVVTVLADETNLAVSARDASVLNRCLDEAIGSAATAHSRQRERFLAREDIHRQQSLAYELDNLLNVATLSLEGVGEWLSPEGQARLTLHAKSLDALRRAVNRSVNDARHGAGLAPKLELVVVQDLLSEITVGATLQARERGMTLTVPPTSPEIAIAGDRYLLDSAIWSLLQNAFELTRAGGQVLLRATATPTRVWIEVCDQCGGLPETVDCLLHRLLSSPHHSNRRSGLGLAIAMSVAQAHLGDLHIRDIPGEGCVFSLDLPRHQMGGLPPQLPRLDPQR